MGKKRIDAPKLPPAKLPPYMKKAHEKIFAERKNPFDSTQGTKVFNANSVLEKAGLTRQMVELKVADILLMNTRETNEVKAADETSNFDRIIVSVVESAQRNADTQRLDNLLEKIFGKTIKVEGSVKVESNQEMDFADENLMRRAIERAIRNSQL